MPTLLGAAAIVALLMLFGVLDATGFFRALPLLLLLFGVSLVSILVAEANLGRGWMPWAGLGVPTALMLWTAWRPGKSRTKLWIMSGASFTMRSGKWLALMTFGLMRPVAGFASATGWRRAGRGRRSGSPRWAAVAGGPGDHPVGRAGTGRGGAGAVVIGPGVRPGR